uniref:Protein pelota homolog n=1 Tax=Paramoeba aestuarina TaxID=180227 RepID=A0A7S4NLS2_9EUKA
MKLLLKKINEKDGSGSVALIAQDAEDLWHLYQLITVGDEVTMKTVRRVQKESAVSVDSEKKKITLTIRVVSVDFNPGAEVMRVNGRNSRENQYVKMDAFHNFSLEVNRKVTITKEYWDDLALDRIEEACNPDRTADTAVVIMQEGLAHVCLITPNMTLCKNTIEVNIPGKRKGRDTGHSKALNKFYEQVYKAVQNLDFKVVKCIVLASPGFVRDNCYKYMMEQAIRQDNRALIENKGKFILVHSSSGHRHALKEVLSDPSVTVQMNDTKAAKEVKALNELFAMLKDDPDRATYGPAHVERVAELDAIDSLLILDDLFRSCDVKTRKKYIELMDSVKKTNGQVFIFSAQHVSGAALKNFTGIAATLRFPVHDEEFEEFEDEDDFDFSDEEEGGPLKPLAAS